MPTTETCFNCFETRSSDAKKIIKKDDKTAREIQKLRNLSRPPPPPPWRGRGSRQDGATVPGVAILSGGVFYEDAQFLEISSACFYLCFCIERI